jgi:hypothetical protein
LSKFQKKKSLLSGKQIGSECSANSRIAHSLHLYSNFQGYVFSKKKKNFQGYVNGKTVANNSKKWCKFNSTPLADAVVVDSYYCVQSKRCSSEKIDEMLKNKILCFTVKLRMKGWKQKKKWDIWKEWGLSLFWKDDWTEVLVSLSRFTCFPAYDVLDPELRYSGKRYW